LDDFSDQQLLREYATRRSEAAFAELVRRRVDMVYSTARRIVRDSQLAEEVTQSAFVELARNAAKASECAVVSAWLHRVAHNLAANVVRQDVRRKIREGKAAAMNEMFATDAGDNWEDIEGRLDDALQSLSEGDRDAIVLRFFEGKSAVEIAGVLGVSAEAAQKRVSRAVDRLRGNLARTGGTVATGALVGLLSTHAVQAAPASLAASISTAIATLGGPSIAVAAAAKTLAMSTLQKSVFAGTIMVLLGTGVYEAHRASTAETEIEKLRTRGGGPIVEARKWQSEAESASATAKVLSAENQRLREEVAELPALRGEVARLRTAQGQRSKAPAGLDVSDPSVQAFLNAREKAQQIEKYLEAMPDKRIPEIGLLNDEDWLAATREAKFDSDTNIRRTLQHLRSLAKQRLPLGSALDAYTKQHDGELPRDLSELKPFLNDNLREARLTDATLDAILNRYALVRSGNVADMEKGTHVIVEKAPVDKEYDSRAKFGVGRSSIYSTGLHETGDPDDKSY
jgi:RNA polymerase sigma factor (sigma-70 family)